VLAIRKELRNFRPDIVHAHWWMPAGFAAKIAIATTAGDFRLLITCHGTDYYVLGERFSRLRRWVFAGADAIAVVSPAMREHAVARNLFEDKIHVAPMGVDLRSRFVPDKNKDRRGVLYVGRLVAGKGVDDLLNAWAATSAPVRSQGLTIIGDGSQRSAMQNLSESLSVTDSVTFLGPVTHDDLPAYYQQAALLVFPSAGKEGLGLVAIEAMGCDCPVLTSDTGSLADVVVEGQTGFVYPMGNATAMAQRLNELVAAQEFCTKIGVQGGNAVRSRFDWTVTGQTYQGLYEGLLTSDSI
jgi:glycosyltransferase involved in cell wall biosynthesis